MNDDNECSDPDSHFTIIDGSHSLSLSDIDKLDVYSTLSFPDLFGMNGEQHVPSNKTNLPSPVQSWSPAPPGDEKSLDGLLRDSPDSSSPHRTSTLMNWSSHDLKVAADQGEAAVQNNDRLDLDVGTGASKDLKGVAHYFKLSADQGDPDA
jgi:hypothetical protein